MAKSVPTSGSPEEAAAALERLKRYDKIRNTEGVNDAIYRSRVSNTPTPGKRSAAINGKPPVTTPSVAGASLRNAQVKAGAGATPAVSPTKISPVTGRMPLAPAKTKPATVGRGGGSALTRGTAPKVTSAPGRTAAGKNFDQSFAAARRAGLDQFTWNGKRYNTKVK